MEAYKKLKQQRECVKAPVDTMGCACVDAGLGEETKMFQILVRLLLSSQTRDAVTHAAVAMLNEKLGILTPENVCNAPPDLIKECISKASYYSKKHEYLLEISQRLRNSPMLRSLEAVLALRGIGKKMAYLYMQHACGSTVGIGVDTHVHRISRRIGLCNTPDPERTRIELERIFERSEWPEINRVMVGFGQTICLPECFAKFVCPSSRCRK